MLYVFHGTQISKSIEKAHALIDSLRTKRPDAFYVKIESDGWRNMIIEEHLGGQGLFSNKYIIFLDRVTENSEAKEILASFVPAMQESANIFIVSECKINAELKKTFDKNADKVVISDEAKVPFVYGKSSASKNDFNIFTLADAVGGREKMKAWMIYREAIKNGLEAESILGTLFWQVKSMIIATNSKSAVDAGLKPFVYEKSKKHAKNYSKEELNNLLENIIVLYHDGHRGLINMELGIERMMLG